MPKRSPIALLAALVGGASLLAAIAGVLGASTGMLSPLGGFTLFRWAVLPGAPLALVLGLIGVWHARASTGRGGRGLAWLGALDGLLLIGVAAAAIAPHAGAPLIHDVTTDLEDPPAFSSSVAKAEGRVNGVVYPDGGDDVPELQRAAYPDLAPIAVPLDGMDAYERAREAAEALGWKITLARKSGGRLQAEVVSPLFHFVDDVAVRVREVRYDQSRVDVRSSSRVGLGDLGANAARIRAFRDKLLELVKASKPSGS